MLGIISFCSTDCFATIAVAVTRRYFVKCERKYTLEKKTMLNGFCLMISIASLV